MSSKNQRPSRYFIAISPTSRPPWRVMVFASPQARAEFSEIYDETHPKGTSVGCVRLDCSRYLNATQGGLNPSHLAVLPANDCGIEYRGCPEPYGEVGACFCDSPSCERIFCESQKRANENKEAGK